MNNSRMLQTIGFGTDFWNDSCDERELQEAISHGATGATSNPVIVASVIRNNPGVWNPVIARLVSDHPLDTEDNIARALIVEVGRKAARLLLPAFEISAGKKGRLSLQVNPKYYRDAQAMVVMAKELSEVAPNISVKIPVVPAGLEAMEEVTACGLTVTPTVCFSVAQAVAAGEAIERGLERAMSAGIPVDTIRPNVAIMVGRLDDHLKRVMESKKICIDPGILEWAGIAVFKRAYSIFRQHGFRSNLLSAAYRNHMHWSEFIGGDVTLSIPFDWWRRFNDSAIRVDERISNPVCPGIIEALETSFHDFRRAYEPDGLAPDEFTTFGPTIHTLKQFIAAHQDLSTYIREQLLG